MAANGIMTTAGVVDSGYRGEVIVLLTNLSRYWYPKTIKAGDKIAQMIPIPVLTGEGVMAVEELHEADRGSDGFGSTGR